MYFSLKVKKKSKNLFKLYFKEGSKLKSIGFCRIDSLYNFFYFINLKKIVQFFVKNKDKIVKFRISLKFSLSLLKIFLGFLKILIKSKGSCE